MCQNGVPSHVWKIWRETHNNFIFLLQFNLRCAFFWSVPLPHQWSKLSAERERLTQIHDEKFLYFNLACIIFLKSYSLAKFEIWPKDIHAVHYCSLYSLRDESKPYTSTSDPILSKKNNISDKKLRTTRRPKLFSSYLSYI